MKNQYLVIIFIVGLIILISVLDLLANAFGALPFLGTALETVSESVLEAIQILLASILALIAAKKVR